jgi:4-phospho-D-threonate 3-dehydrogenase / 4-phospho-D-erythronate 3-dehydrogenase
MILGVTMGDSSGVGPEILLKAFRNGEIRHDIVAFGDLDILEYCNQKLGYGVALRKAAAPGDLEPGWLNVLDLGSLNRADLRIGEISAPSGAAARQYVVAAAKAAVAGEIAAFATLPMNKEATRLTDPKFTGHTELVASICGVEEAVLMLVSDALIVTHVSSHMSLSEAIGRVKFERVRRVIELTCEAAGKLRQNPRIAVAGLNPHAGESGLFGDEEIKEIGPAVHWAKAHGLPVEGPIPPDTVFYMAVARKRFDAVVCMYHDQGHIPLKLLDFDGGVNTTLGLPIIRTSVDHGTAFDIAWNGTASTQSFVKALDMAANLIKS